ncbi:MAG: DUF1573 domain-containing protein [Bacteroidota bacterium]
MNNKVICFLALSALLFTACKKEEKVDVPAPENSSVTINQPAVQQSIADPEPESTAPKTEMVFTENEHDFGTINQGDKVMHVFTFKNTGTNDLIITRANGSCGCTVPEYPKEPIAPGKTGTMKVSFNSTGKSGEQKKTVSVMANTPKGVEVLTIKANIKVDKITTKS